MQFQCSSCEKLINTDNDDFGKRVNCSHCENAIQIPNYYLDPGFVIGEHIIEKEIGEGHYGRVFKAHQISLDRAVALKILHPQYATNSNFIVEFFKEARATASLTHPNIVQSYSINEENGIYYQTLEFVAGGNLRSLLASKGTLDATFSTAIMHQIAEALDFAWRQNKILHSDLKPENILLKNNTQVKVSDLGLSGSNEMKYEERYASQYFSPEKILKTKTDQRSEIYCMGILFYELLAGHCPFNGASAEEIHKQHTKVSPPELHKLNHDIPISLSRIVAKMLTKHPDDRYQSFADFIRDLKFFKQGKSISYETDNIEASDAPSKQRTKAAKVRIPSNKKNKHVPKKKSQQPSNALAISIIVMITVLAGLLILLLATQKA